MLLLDTNVLVYALNDRAPQHSECRTVLQRAAAGDVPAVLLPQILIECYSVVTSPRRVANPLTPEQAWGVMRSISRVIEVRPTPGTLLEDLDRVMARHSRRGQSIFDLMLVAQMLSHGIHAICTCNAHDFAMPGIAAVHPAQALAVYT